MAGPYPGRSVIRYLNLGHTVAVGIERCACKEFERGEEGLHLLPLFYFWRCCMVLPEDLDVSADNAVAVAKLVDVGYDVEAAQYIVDSLRAGTPLDF